MRTRFSMLLALLCLLPALVMASTPRGYKTVPAGYNLFEIIYANTRGDADTDSPLPGSMLSIDRHTTILRYVKKKDPERYANLISRLGLRR